MSIFTAPIDELVAFIDSLDEAMALLPGSKRLSSRQKRWLGVCLTGVIVTHSLWPLTVDRNRKWIQDIENLLREQDDYLVVVGALHLVGKDSVVQLLEGKGYKVIQK